MGKIVNNQLSLSADIDLEVNGFNTNSNNDNVTIGSKEDTNPTRLSKRVKIKTFKRDLDEELPLKVKQHASKKNNKNEANNKRKQRTEPSSLSVSATSQGNNPGASSNHESSSSSSNMSLYYDPNKATRNLYSMVQFHQFSDDLMPPFRVKIKLDALVLIDLHAHCVLNEVIGCLGGYYCHVTRTLNVLRAEPCLNIDEHETRCEMDPVSQAIALEKLESKNLKMVGWYHSHPTFAPNPSNRDMATQNELQCLFAPQDHNRSNPRMANGQKEESSSSSSSSDNHRPFVALIISPFNNTYNQNNLKSSKSFTMYEPIIDYPVDAKFYANDTIYRYHHQHNKSYRYFTHEFNSVLASPVKCFWVGNPRYSKTPMPFAGKQTNCLVPYEIDTIWIRDENFIPSITNRLSELCQWLEHSKTKSVVDLLRRYTRIGSINVTYLEKLIASLSYHLQNPSVSHLCTEYESERIRLECIAILIKELIDNRQETALHSKRLLK